MWKRLAKGTMLNSARQPRESFRFEWFLSSKQNIKAATPFSTINRAGQEAVVLEDFSVEKRL